MPKRWFKCPDGEQIEISSCLEKCRMGQRCAPVSYLKMAAEERPWKGRPSVTQLERCGRQLWLQNREDYLEDPDSSAFKILGTGTHKKMEAFGDEAESLEQKLMIEGVSGVTDLVEQEGDEFHLIDHKTVGSFAVVKMLGISQIGEKPILDELGEPVMYVRGPKKGTPKVEAIYGPDPNRADMSDYTLQPNVYRLAWEKANPGKRIAKMFIFAIVRDGGLYIAQSRGVHNRKYLIEVPFMDEEEILQHVTENRDRIVAAMESETPPPIGTDRQTWGGKFCQSYCPVREQCGAIGDNYWLTDTYTGGDE